MNLKMENMFCIICNKPKSATESASLLSRHKVTDDVTTTWVTPNRFFHLLDKYLGDGNNHNHSGPDISVIRGNVLIFEEKVLNNFMICSEDCAKITQSFCQLYNQLEYIKLQLNWKVQTLSNLMSSAQNDNDQSQIERAWGNTNLLETETGSMDKMIELVNGFRSNLIKKCTRKLEGSFPRLTLRKCKPIATVNKLNQADTNDVLPCQMKSEPGLFSLSPKVENITSRESIMELETFPGCDNEPADHEQLQRMDSYISSNETGNNFKEEVSCNTKFDEIVDNHAFSNEVSHDSHRHDRESAITLSETNQTKTSNVEPSNDEPEVSSSLIIKIENPDCSDDVDYDALDDSTDTSESDDEENSASPTPTSPSDSDENPPNGTDNQLLPPEPVIISSSTSKKKSRFQCPLCRKDFAERHGYTRHHRDVHLRIKAFKCPTCGQNFARDHHLSKHLRNPNCNNGDKEIISDKDRKFSCPACNKRFTGRYDLSRHVNRGTCNKPKATEKADEAHLCSICGKVFTRVNHLERHVRVVHLKLGRATCDQCGKVFSSPSHLSTHVKLVHLKLREYICEQCGKAFSRAYHLKKHVQSIHSVRDQIMSKTSFNWKS